MVQQGQVFKLKAKSADGQPLWAYRYRLEGRASARPQVGGFASRAEAQKALQKALERLGPGGRGATMTLGELVDEYLEMHQAEPITIAKLRWLLGKATATFGEVRLADLSPKDVYAWRFTVPEGHRFEATQALRQVLNRAVAWGLLDSILAKRGRAEPAPPAEGEAAVRIMGAGRGSCRTTRSRLRADGCVRRGDWTSSLGTIWARATRHRSCGRCRLRPARVRERPPQAHQDTFEQPRSSASGQSARSTRPPAAIGEPDSVSELARRTHRFPQLRSPSLETRPDRRRYRAAAPSLRHAPQFSS